MLTRVALLLLAVAIGALPAQAATIQHAYRFGGRVSVEDGRVRAVREREQAALPTTWVAGEPEIPYDIVTFLVPRGSQLASVRAVAVGERVLREGEPLRMAGALAAEDGTQRDPLPSIAKSTPAALAVAGASGTLPLHLVEALSSGALHGYQLQSLRVQPVRWDPATERLSVVERIDLTIELTPGGALPIERQRYSVAIEAKAERTVARLVANPEAIATYDRRIGALVERGHGGFAPSAAPSLEGSDVDYVIVTTEALAPSWQVLADWKTRRGVPTVVRTVEWAQANYRRGGDVQETIRTFAKDAYSKWAVQYLLLAGDTDVLPARYGFSAFGPPQDRDIPCDLYFGCLDGNWNKDGDALFAEPAPNGIDPGDSTDFYPEVHVGRLTAGTPGEVSDIVAKIMTYENPTSVTYQNKLLLLGEVLSPVNWDTTQGITLDGGDLCENLATEVGGCTAIDRLYENFTDFPLADPLSRQATIDAMNTGYGIVNHVGHGFRYNMSCGDVSLQNFHALGLTNADKRFLLYMLNCTATAFDFPCLAEAFLEADGGAVAVLGASRSTFPLPVHTYNRQFFEAVYQQGIVHLGEAFDASRLPQTPNAWFDTADHYSHLLYALLGDPEMVLHTCALGTTAASFPASVTLGLTNVTVNVTVNGVPRAGALVCLQKGTEEYQFGTTNGAGSVTIPFRTETSGLIQVAVSGQNMRTFLGTLAALTGGQPYVRNQSVAIDDTNSPPSNGNADGVLDAGETLELTTVFHNSGSGSANTLTGILRIPSPFVTVTDSTYTLANIAAGATATSTNQVAFTVQSSAPDGTVLPLTFRTTRAATTTYVDVVNRVVHAPVMRLTLLDIDDFPPGGNNDGVIQAGETFDLIAWFKNYGSGAADGLSATLASGDPDVTIFNNAVAIGRADPMEQLTGATRFRLRESVLAENAMTLTLTDNRGRTLVSNITLRGPATPALPTLDASTGPDVVLVRWTPNVEADLAGYHVYRATQLAGPYVRATIDRTLGIAYVRDTGLNPSAAYFYRVTAVDASGNESAPSPTANVSTNPAQLGGWPITLEAPTSSSLVAGDITGDGIRDVVAGNEHLYAWTAAGIELRDDDGDPETWGVFLNEIKTVTAAPSLAELDPAAPGFEVFALSWDDSNKAFTARGNGSILAGWPRNPDPSTTQKGYWANAAAADVDGDGRDELFAAAKNGNLYAWRWNGTPLGAQQAFKTGLGNFARTAPSFANLDGDPALEIVYGSPTGILHVWNTNGTNVAPFPKTLGTECIANTAIGDVDKNGVLDIVMIVEGGGIHVINSITGNELPGWPKTLPFDGNPRTPSPALASLDGDGFLDIVVACNDVNVAACAVRVYDHLGNVRAGWPVVTGATSESSPVVADFTGDAIPDIVFGNESGLIYGWNRNGQSIAGFPLTVGDFIRSVPHAVDVDGDGNINLLLAGWDQNVYVWNFPVPWVEQAAQWPTLSHDVRRTGFYRQRVDATTDAGPGGALAAPPARPVLAQNVPNPFNPTTTIEYGVPASGTGAAAGVWAAVAIYDVQGRRVRQLVAGTHTPGMHRVVWDGRDDHGRRARSGVYFYRLQVGEESIARKLLLLQ